jgi:hypothetical protein
MDPRDNENVDSEDVNCDKESLGHPECNYEYKGLDLKGGT